MGATYDPWKDGFAIEANQKESQNRAMGVFSLSVIPKVGTPFSRACRAASTVACRQRPKLMAISTSLEPSRLTFWCKLPVDPMGASASYPSEVRPLSKG